MQELARVRAKRKHLYDKDSNFRVNKKPVDQFNIDRYVKRHEISEETLLSMASPMKGKHRSGILLPVNQLTDQR